MLRNLKLFYSFSIVLLLFGCSDKIIANYQSNNQEIDSLNNSSSLDSIISPYRDSMKELMDEVIGYSGSSFIKNGPESSLGNFVADVVFNNGLAFISQEKNVPIHKVISLINFGGLRAPINEGIITVGNIYELMPFDNSIVILELSPDKVSEMLLYLYEKNGQPISNAKAKLSNDKKEIYIKGAEYLFDVNLFVITSDYLADGGDKMNFFKNPVSKVDSGILIRDALIEYVKGVDTLSFRPVEGRIIIEK